MLLLSTEDDMKPERAPSQKAFYNGPWLQISSHTTSCCTAKIQRFSNGKITFQSFFMPITVHLLAAAASDTTCAGIAPPLYKFGSEE